MPIMDYDGTANYTVGTIYDWDGTANYQVGKVYDGDGTASYLIYSTETAYFDGGQTVPWSEYELSSNCPVTIGTNIDLYANRSTSLSVAYTTNKIDITNIKTLYFTFSSVTFQNNGTLWVGVSDKTGANLNPFVSGSYTKYTQVTASGTVSVDVSSLTGSYYIGLSFSSSTGAGGRAYCTKVWGE